MKRIFLASLAAIALLTMTALDALACWEDVPLERVVGNSPVVVVGSLGKAEQKKHKEHGQLKVAYISVSDILKNTLPNIKISKGDRIPLSMPNNGDSTDIVHAKGTSGIWILEFRDKTFWATYPKDFQPMSKERDVRQFIKKQEQESSNKAIDSDKK